MPLSKAQEDLLNNHIQGSKVQEQLNNAIYIALYPLKEGLSTKPISISYYSSSELLSPEDIKNKLKEYITLNINKLQDTITHFRILSTKIKKDRQFELGHISLTDLQKSLAGEETPSFKELAKKMHEKVSEYHELCAQQFPQEFYSKKETAPKFDETELRQNYSSKSILKRKVPAQFSPEAP